MLSSQVHGNPPPPQEFRDNFSDAPRSERPENKWSQATAALIEAPCFVEGIRSRAFEKLDFL
jgi:hypothetical protein